jgi:hypothetical protein
MKAASCLANTRGPVGGGAGVGAPERWNRGETENEFPETGNKTLSHSVTQGGGGGGRGGEGGGWGVGDSSSLVGGCLWSRAVLGSHLAFCREVTGPVRVSKARSSRNCRDVVRCKQPCLWGQHDSAMDLM